MGQPVAGSNPALSANPRTDGVAQPASGLEAIRVRHSAPVHGILRRAVLGGELAVPCTCNPLQQG